ncbi:MAG: NPCBM/NEW2 domain-containing protein [Mariniblastus sp.]
MSEIETPPFKCARNMQSRLFHFLFLIGCFIFVSTMSASAQELGKCSIDLLDGTTVEATVASIDAAGNVTGPDVPGGLKLQDVLAVTTERAIEKSSGEGAVSIITLEGGRIAARNLKLGDEKLVFDSQAGIQSLPLQALRAIVWSKSSTVENAIRQPSKENDKVIVKSEDGEAAYEGLFESLDSERIGLNYQGESQTIGLDKVAAVVTADLGMSGPQGSSANVGLVDGSNLVGVISTIADGVLTMKIAGDSSVSLKAESIVEITITSDRLQYLSDVEPADVEERAVFAVQRTWKRDRSVENNPLSIRIGKSAKSVEFKKGLGVQAFSRLVFGNPKEFDRFNATVGIDAETKGRGDCVMTVRGDGIELWSKRIQGSGEPVAVDLDITGIKEVELLVYPGEDFDLGDHANWAEARFLKTK